MANIARESFDSKEAWPIRQVTVYEDRAQITRTLDFKVSDFGEVELKLENLPMAIMTESLRAEVESGNATVLEVAHKDNYPQTPSVPQTDREKEIQKRFTELELERQALYRRLNWLNQYANKTIPESPVYKSDSKKTFEGLVNPQNLGNYVSYLDFNDEEVGKADERLIDIEIEKNQLTEEAGKIRQQAMSEAAKSVTVSREATVLINVTPLPEKERPEGVALAQVITIKLVYVVVNASWNATYDMRVQKATNNVALSYYGKVINNTGEPWYEVTMLLSTAKPSRAGNLAKLPRAEVRIKKPIYIAQPRIMKKQLRFAGKKEASKSYADKMGESLYMEEAFGMEKEEAADYDDDNDDIIIQQEQIDDFVKQDYTEAESKGGSAVFKLARLVSIDADGKPHKQTIGAVKLAPTFSYIVSPKVTPNCFLKCLAKNISDFVFVPGPMSVFFNDSFVTTTTMNLVRQKESFHVYLGVEESVKVDYQPEISKTENVAGMIFKGKTKTKSVSRTIRIINTRNEDIDCILYEQVPFPNDKLIKVEVESPDLQMTTGTETYRVNKVSHLEAKNVIKKNSQWVVKFSYKIEWPKAKEISFSESLENIEV